MTPSFQFARIEVEYFLLLVEYERAGTSALRASFLEQIRERQSQQAELSQRVTRSKDLTPEDRAIYYSNWAYSAIRNLTAMEGFQQPPALANRLNLELPYVHQVLEFLLSSGLCVQNQGQLRPGPAMTHLSSASPLVSRHHGNWRIKSMERHPMLRPTEELAYTAPMTLSQSDAIRIRSLLADLVEKVDQIVAPSPSEKLFCLNLDWFEVK